MSRPSDVAHEFPVAHRRDPGSGQHYTAQTIHCSHRGCDAVDEIRKTGERLKPVAMLAEKFRQRGWDVGSRRSNDLCPLHSKRADAERKRRETKIAWAPPPAPPVIPTPVTADVAAEKLATLGPVTRSATAAPATAGSKSPNLPKQTGFTRADNALRSAKNAGVPVQEIEVYPEPGGTYGWNRKGVERQPVTVAAPTEIDPHKPPTPKEPAMTAAPSPLRLTAVPPREFTRDERRKAYDAIDAAYDDAHSRYKGSGSDKAIAEAVGLPRVLITEVREQFFGPDANEAEALLRHEVSGIRDEAKKIMDRHLTLATDAEAIMARCNRALGDQK